MANNSAIGPSICFEHVSAARGGRPVLEDVCAAVPAGGNTVVVGPNGAGKTSLLLCLIGEVPFSGSIRFQGEDCRDSIAYVPQSLALDRGLPLSVEDFLALGCVRRPLWLGTSFAVRDEARRLLALVQAEDLGGRQMCALSGGELRRVLLAAALGRQPRLLVLDEPAAGVDVSGERLLWEILAEARIRQGFTQIMVSHNLPLTAHHASHVICLDQRVQAQGPPQQTLTADRLLKLFGVPIHLYPDQCFPEESGCPQCGAVCMTAEAPEGGEFGRERHTSDTMPGSTDA